MEHLAEYILASSIVLLALLVLIGLMAYVFAWRASKKKTTGAQKLQENLLRVSLSCLQMVFTAR